MSKNRFGPYSFGVIVFFIISTITPAFAEVTNLDTNSDYFFRGEEIKFSGNVEDGSQGLVTIVINDTNEELVMISQALINSDNSFEKTIKIGNKFNNIGIYDATAFILNMTKGATIEFGISLDGLPIIDDENKNILKENESKKNAIVDESSTSTSTIVDFVDSSKGVQYYLDRYYNESSYRSWFDMNYPGITIEEAVGQTNKIETNSSVQGFIKKEIIPKAEASLIVESVQRQKNNSEIAQVFLAVAGLGILFGAVYGIKRKVDDNSNQISLNRETIRKRFIQPIIGSNPKEILQIRLAKGEITLEEYEKLKIKLD